MKPESQFVYHWLKAHIQLFSVLGVSFSGWSITSEVPPRGSFDKEIKHETTLDFAITKPSHPRTTQISIKVPACIPALNVYRALIELRDEMPNVNFIIDDKQIDKEIVPETLYDRLRKLT